MRLHDCHFCRDCIDRQIVTALRIDEVISDPKNHVAERQRIIELLRERNRLVEDRDRISAIPSEPSTIPPAFGGSASGGNHSLS